MERPQAHVGDEDLRLAAEALDTLGDRTAEAKERFHGLCVTHGVG